MTAIISLTNQPMERAIKKAMENNGMKN